MTLRFFSITDRPASIAADAIIVGVFEDKTLSPAAAEVDTASAGAIKRMLNSGDISGKLCSVTRLHQLPGITSARVLVVGMGEQKKLDAGRYLRACREVAKQLKDGPTLEVGCYLNEITFNQHDALWLARQTAIAFDSSNYSYTTTLKPSKNGPGLESVGFVGKNLQATLDQASATCDGVRFAKELGNLPPNICNPTYIAEQAQKFAGEHDNVECEVLDREQMQKLGMGALLGVARGSASPPKLIVLQYHGADKKLAPFAMVGKGVTFDTGGISLKPGASMDEMKFDMCGAATVLGTFVAVVKQKLPLNLVCVVPCVENMPDGDAYRPGDVVTSMSGKTIEILNTDAEGRLILCDALTYVQRFKPQALVDVATLTGACVIALGKHASGLMSKHDDLAAELLNAGNTSMDRAWRLPVWDDYQPQLDSVFADFSNLGGKSAGAITAACFLARFTEGQRWAHLDIAGSAWDEGRKGMATGRPVGLLVQWLMDRAS